MRKLFYAVCSIACVALMVACSEQQPTLVGKWVSDTINTTEDESAVTMTMNMDLNEDSTLAVSILAVMDADQKEAKMHMPINASFSGKWADSDNKLEWIVIDSTKVVKLEQDSIKIEFGNPEMEMFKDKLIKSLVEEFEKEGSKQFIDGITSDEAMSYILNGDELKLINDKDTMIFHRQK